MQDSTPDNILKKYEELSDDGFIFSTAAGSSFGITNDYVTRLCRKKKIKGFLLGRLWFVEKKSLKSYLEETKLKREEQHKALSEQLSREYQKRLGPSKPTP